MKTILWVVAILVMAGVAVKEACSESFFQQLFSGNGDKSLPDVTIWTPILRAVPVGQYSIKSASEDDQVRLFLEHPSGRLELWYEGKVRGPKLVFYHTDDQQDSGYTLLKNRHNERQFRLEPPEKGGAILVLVDQLRESGSQGLPVILEFIGSTPPRRLFEKVKDD